MKPLRSPYVRPCPQHPAPTAGEQLSIFTAAIRTLTDLPTSGQPVRLRVEVCRFFCQNASCPRKTFAEALPTLARPHVQRTIRLQAALQCLGQAAGGKAGARLGKL